MKREPPSDSYTKFVALWPIEGGEWKPGQYFRWAVPGLPPASVAITCDFGHPDWVGILLEVQAFNDRETGLPCGLARIERSREKVAIDIETAGGPWFLDPSVGSPMFPRKETAIETGTRIHEEIARHLKGPHHKGLHFQPVVQVHDEYLFEVPTTMTNGRAAYRCENASCPERAPVRVDKAPTCYTCGKPMAVAAYPGDVLTKRNGEMIEEVFSVEDLAKKLGLDMKKRIGDLMTKIPPLFPIKVLEPDLGHQWYRQFPKKTRVAERMNIQAELANWIAARRAWGKNISDGLKDPCETALDIARGEQLDELGRTVGIIRTVGVNRTEVYAGHPEPDDNYRERVRMSRALASRSNPHEEAKFIVGSHSDVVSVRAETRVNKQGEPLVYVEATLAPDKMTDALARELDDRLRNGLPVTTDYQLDVVYSNT